MDKQYDFLVFILRGEPYHNGHHKVAMTALGMAHHVILLLGSAHEARSFRNPFTYEERHDMIYDSFGGEDRARISIRPLHDTLYMINDWLENTQTVVHDVAEAVVKKMDNRRVWSEDIVRGLRKPRIGLIGHSKDHTGYYLTKFPQWGNVNVPGYDDQKLLDATWIRNLYFTERDNSQLMDLVLPAVLPSGTMDLMENFYSSDPFKWIVAEHEYCENYKKPYLALPHEVSFQTVDAVVTQSAHVLLIERRARPGKGLLALPGGFIKPTQRIKEAMVAELTEETALNLKVPERVIQGSIKKFWVFDDPHRDPRGRVFSNTFLISLEAQPKLPKVRGGDDAKRAFWVPLSELDRTQFFNDHYHIIRKMTAGV